MAIPLLSFFTGGGFFDIGFEQAGFRICWTNENNPAFIAGYEQGMSAWLSSLVRKRAVAKIANTSSVYGLAAKQVLKRGVRLPFTRRICGYRGPALPRFQQRRNPCWRRRLQRETDHRLR